MAEKSTFFEHVRYLSARLRVENNMTISEQARGVISLANDIVQLKFFPGDDRDPYVQVHVWYADPVILGPKKYFELRRYVDYCDARKLFPIRYPHDNSEAASTNHLGLNSEYCFVGSALLVLEIMNFLAVHGSSILLADVDKVKDFMEWVQMGDHEYTKRFT